LIPYSRQSVSQEDIRAVVTTLRSDFLTTGPKVEEFEETFAEQIGSKYTLAVSSGTAALHTAMTAIDIRPGDEVIVPAITFVATANAVAYMGATPVFADVDSETLLIDLEDIERKITDKTRAIIAVDYAGQPCDYLGLRQIADKHNLFLIDDACHSLGADYLKIPQAFWAHVSCFSFHPVKSITTGEGGMISFEHPMAKTLLKRAKIFRNHGRTERGMEFLGFNYRLSDISCALGISQLKRLPYFIEKRGRIACKYDEAFSKVPGITPLKQIGGHNSARHLYVVKVRKRDKFRKQLADQGIGTQVHYKPVPLEPYYSQPGVAPITEKEWKNIVSLPIYPGMNNGEVRLVIEAVANWGKHGS